MAVATAKSAAGPVGTFAPEGSARMSRTDGRSRHVRIKHSNSAAGPSPTSPATIGKSKYMSFVTTLEQEAHELGVGKARASAGSLNEPLSVRSAEPKSELQLIITIT